MEIESPTWSDWFSQQWRRLETFIVIFESISSDINPKLKIMEMSEAALKIHGWLQKIIRLPLIVEEPDRLTIAENPNYTRFHRTTWRLIMFTSLLLCIFSLFQIIKIHFTSSPSAILKWADVEQISLYELVISINLGGLSAYYMESRFPSEVCFLGTQSLKFRIKQMHLVNTKRTGGVPSLKSLLMYSIIFPSILFSSTNFVLPFLRPYDPVQVFFGANDFGIWGSYLFKVAGSIIFGLPTCLSVLICFQGFLAIIFIAENSFLLSKAMYDRGPVIRAIQRCLVQGMIRKFVFKKHFSTYRQFQIIICGMNQISYVLVSDLLFLGSFTFVMCIYTAVKLHHKLPSYILLAVGCYIVGYLILSPVLLSLGAMPHEKSIAFHHFWFCLLKNKVERKQLKACKLLAYSAGPIPVVQAKTQMDINDVLANATATLILM
ncbi:unnamed protein product [Orchesella dallaii]|uniref:Odorant receptor n=1 Tax=Orchesella dallaii TaxID=48710 RepID=A0ABP1S871_9HEXA